MLWVEFFYRKFCLGLHAVTISGRYKTRNMQCNSPDPFVFHQNKKCVKGIIRWRNLFQSFVSQLLWFFKLIFWKPWKTSSASLIFVECCTKRSCKRTSKHYAWKIKTNCFFYNNLLITSVCWHFVKRLPRNLPAIHSCKILQLMTNLTTQHLCFFAVMQRHCKM